VKPGSFLSGFLICPLTLTHEITLYHISHDTPRRRHPVIHPNVATASSTPTPQLDAQSIPLYPLPRSVGDGEAVAMKSVRGARRTVTRTDTTQTSSTVYVADL
jgi:hypothetical protein